MRQQATYETAGCLFGCALAWFLWIWPLPVVWVVMIFDLKGLFADYMYWFLPVVIMCPLAGAYIGKRISKPTNSQ